MSENISSGKLIKATDIFDKFKSDISADLASIATGVAALATALSSTSVPPNFKYYANKYGTNRSVLEELMFNLNTLETTYAASWNGQSLATPRHLQPTFDATEASGRVVQHDFIGAYHLRAFIESLYAIAANIRNIEISFGGSIPVNITNKLIPFNDFALNNNDQLAAMLANGTYFSSQLSDERYINTNTVGRQVVTNGVSAITAISTGQQEISAKASAPLEYFYDASPSSWINGSNTGIVNKFNELTAINYRPANFDPLPDTPGFHDPIPVETKLAGFYDGQTGNKIRSQIGGVKHLVTANTVVALFNECRALLTKLKTDLLGRYVYSDAITEPTTLALPCKGFGSLGYPYSKNWFISRTATSAASLYSLSSFVITSGVAYNAGEVAYNAGYATNAGDCSKSHRNDEFAYSESYPISSVLRPGYSKFTSLTGLNGLIDSYYCPMPLTYQRRESVCADLANTSNKYLRLEPKDVFHGTDVTYIHLDSTKDSTSDNMSRVCISWPEWNNTVPPPATTSAHQLRHYYAFLPSYKSVIIGANTGIRTDKYKTQCVIPGYGIRGADNSIRTVLSTNISDCVPTTINFALAKYNPTTSATTVITADTEMPTNLGFTITSWASLNEVKHSHGTRASATYAIDNISATIELANYTGGHKTLPTQTTAITGASNVNTRMYVRHTTTSAEIPDVFEQTLYRFRYRYAALYGDSDLLAARDEFSPEIKTELRKVLKVGGGSNGNLYFEGCGGGIAETVYIVDRVPSAGYYGASVVPTFKYAVAMDVLQSETDAVSQGYFGYEGFQFSYNVTGTTISDITQARNSNLLAFVPLPTDITISSSPGDITGSTHVISVSSTHWWDTLSYLQIYPTSAETNLTTLSSSLSIIDGILVTTNIPLSAAISDYTIIATNNYGGKIREACIATKTYTITFNPGDGTGVMSSILNVQENKPTTLTKVSDFTAPSGGYEFDKWQTPITSITYTDEETILVNDTTAANSTLALTATWKLQI